MTASTAMPPLPARRHLGDLADLRPVVIVDTREQDSLPITRLPMIRGTLQSGDYSFTGGQELFAIERKSIADLVGCCVGDGRERFERELHRLRGFRFKRLLIIGGRSEIETHRYRSNVNPLSVLHSLSAWEIRYDIPPIFAADPDAAGHLVEGWVYWYARETVKSANALLGGASEGNL